MKRGEQTKKKILEMGLKMWLENPNSVNSHAISKRIGMTHASIIYHYPYGVRNAVAEYALEVENVKVIAQLIAEDHPCVQKLSPSERMSYLKKSCYRRA